ncbi:5'-methylthioadenosine nucleosidase @ S-adenosylhomocysteine nucleosidase [hydrothermal vent metagenome]|uniref:5'-methylthioadenosine nucleosidase @ S-adenosylhomocysteine nucleosidase n=1 Tax=hydrothermal vent metagenome TaxID=652676 RepID=A0A3B0TES8_9ZZZZ
MNFELKRVYRTDILYVMAVQAEYGSHLKQRFSPLFTGVGPVEAAMSLSCAISDLKANKQLPDLIISLGSAGSRELMQTEIYQASSVSYRDMDASFLGFEKGKTPYLDQPAKLELSPLMSGIKKASLSTGAKIISGSDYDLIDAQMVDMESFALKRVCQTFNLPMIAFRGISDGDEELSGHHSWTQYLHIIDEKLAKIIDQLETQIKDEQFKL